MINTNLPEFKTKGQGGIIPLVIGTMLGARGSSGGGNARQFRNQDISAERAHLRNKDLSNQTAGNQRAQTTHATNEELRKYEGKKEIDRKYAKKAAKSAGAKAGAAPASAAPETKEAPTLGQQFKSVGASKHKTAASVKRAIGFPDSPTIKLGSGKPKSTAPALAPATDLSGM